MGPNNAKHIVQALDGDNAGCWFTSVVALMSLVCSRREQTKKQIYIRGLFLHSNTEITRRNEHKKYCETTRIETERENDN